MGKIVTFSGPRGVGKSTIMSELRDRWSIKPIVPYTTRDPRPNEVDGQDYLFVTDYEFEKIRRSKGMFDVLTLPNTQHRYGTPLEEFDRVTKGPNGSIEFLRTISLAAASALELRRQVGSTAVKTVFVLPRSWGEIERQMEEDGIPKEQILERRSSEPTDLTMLPEFDHIMVNAYRERDQAVRNAGKFIGDLVGVTLEFVERPPT